MVQIHKHICDFCKKEFKRPNPRFPKTVEIDGFDICGPCQNQIKKDIKDFIEWKGTQESKGTR